MPSDRRRRVPGAVPRLRAGGGAGNTYSHTSAPLSPSSATTRSRLGKYITPPTTMGTAVELPPSWCVQLEVSVATLAAVISVNGE